MTPAISIEGFTGLLAALAARPAGRRAHHRPPRHGVRSGTWRILVGQDAAWLDRLVRARPEAAYDYEELFNEAAEAEYTSAATAAGEPPM